ncbi:hypothetical protein KM043_008320 [Ampulex compressa]|nr:hypothetical protein KM043_008320 [Ampulex compressa]
MLPWLAGAQYRTTAVVSVYRLISLIGPHCPESTYSSTCPFHGVHFVVAVGKKERGEGGEQEEDGRKERDKVRNERKVREALRCRGTRHGRVRTSAALRLEERHLIIAWFISRFLGNRVYFSKSLWTPMLEELLTNVARFLTRDPPSKVPRPRVQADGECLVPSRLPPSPGHGPAIIFPSGVDGVMAGTTYLKSAALIAKSKAETFRPKRQEKLSLVDQADLRGGEESSFCVRTRITARITASRSSSNPGLYATAILGPGVLRGPDGGEEARIVLGSRRDGRACWRTQGPHQPPPRNEFQQVETRAGGPRPRCADQLDPPRASSSADWKAQTEIPGPTNFRGRSTVRSITRRISWRWEDRAGPISNSFIAAGSGHTDLHERAVRAYVEGERISPNEKSPTTDREQIPDSIWNATDPVERVYDNVFGETVVARGPALFH